MPNLRLFLRALVLPVALGLFSLAHAAKFTLETAGIQDIQAAVDAGALTYEKLVKLYLARIEAYDQKGPALNTVITLNPKALETARKRPWSSYRAELASAIARAFDLPRNAC